ELPPAADVVAEAVGAGLQRREGLDVGLLLRGVHATGREGHLYLVTSVLRGFLDCGAATENDQVGKRNLLAELLLDCLEFLQNLFELIRLVALPVFLGTETNARAVRAAAFVGTPECRSRRPGGRDKLRYRKAAGEDLLLQCRDVLLSDEPMIDRGNRVLPDQGLLRYERTEVTRTRTHVAVRKLEPSAGKRVREFFGMFVKVPRDFLVGRIEAQ